MLRAIRNDFWRRRELIRQLAERDLKTRYKVSVLGFFWSLLRPLLTIAVLAAVFSMLDLDSGVYDAPYWMILPVAYIPWFFFSSALLEGTQSLLANAHLIKKVYCPPAVYPASVVLSNLVNFLLSMAVVAGLILLVSPARPTLSLLWLPLATGCLTLFLLGLVFFFATLNVLYRDTTQICEFLVFVWFYLSPVLYDMGVVFEELGPGPRWLYLANPMAGLIEWHRYIFLEPLLIPSEEFGQSVLRGAVPYSAAASLAVFAGGYAFMKAFETRAADQL